MLTQTLPNMMIVYRDTKTKERLLTTSQNSAQVMSFVPNVGDVISFFDIMYKIKLRMYDISKNEVTLFVEIVE